MAEGGNVLGTVLDDQTTCDSKLFIELLYSWGGLLVMLDASFLHISMMIMVVVTME